jgi:anthranilate synthase/aminodeoxychorismate synthase-like glutamine amidotransferase
MILFIDNYDSYVYNLVQYVSRHRTDYRVVRNDALAIDDIDPAEIDRIILSPGPCGPLEAGVSNAVWRELGHRVPVLGICLGHQCLGHVFGMRVERAREVVHGKASWIEHEGGRLFEGVPRAFEAGRYHSLVVSGPVPDALRVSARLADGTIMGLEHRQLPLFGLQFHPESILTPSGRTILANFLEIDPADYPAMGDREALEAPAVAGPVDRGEPGRSRTERGKT